MARWRGVSFGSSMHMSLSSCIFLFMFEPCARWSIPHRDLCGAQTVIRWRKSDFQTEAETAAIWLFQVLNGLEGTLRINWANNPAMPPPYPGMPFPAWGFPPAPGQTWGAPAVANSTASGNADKSPGKSQKKCPKGVRA